VARATRNVVILKDPDNRIQWVNDSFTRIYGYSLDDCRGLDAGTLMLGPDVGATAQTGTRSESEHHDGAGRDEVVRFGRDGAMRWFVLERQTLMDGDGVVSGYIEVETDITVRKQAEICLRKAKQAAEVANVAKSDYLTTMSHEIRTPMNAVIGLTELALNTELTVEQREYLSLVKASSAWLLKIVNNVLDMSRIEAGCLEVEVVPFSLSSTIDDVVNMLVHQARGKGLRLKVEIAPALPDGLLGDPLRLSQILVNLVGNAIKFSTRGDIVVRVSSESGSGLTADDNELVCRFSVSDTGVGIPLEQQDAIFKPFQQAALDTARLHGGSGLGLSIVSRLVQIMRGRIWLDSAPGKGSTFYFTARFGCQAFLTMSELASEAAANTPPSTSRSEWGRWRHEATAWNLGYRFRSGLARMRRVLTIDGKLPGVRTLEPGPDNAADNRRADLRALTNAAEGVGICVNPVTMKSGEPKLSILLVEDNPTNRRFAQIVLEQAGHRVVTADTGPLALKILECNRLDLVLMDVQMPGMDGLATTAAIRKREQRLGGHIPVIGLTAHAMQTERNRCLNAGMDACLTKPIQPGALLETIRGLLGPPVIPNKPVVLVSPPEPPRRLPASDRVIDTSALLAQVGGSQRLMNEISELFARDGPAMMAKARRAIARDDADGLDYALHSLHGMFCNFGAVAALELTEVLQQLSLDADWDAVELIYDQLDVQVERLKVALANVTVTAAQSTK